jgi:hypothetical protein
MLRIDEFKSTVEVSDTTNDALCYLAGNQTFYNDRVDEK